MTAAQQKAADDAAAASLAATVQQQTDSLKQQLANQVSLSQAATNALANIGNNPQPAAGFAIPAVVWYIAAAAGAYWLYKKYRK